MTYKELQDENDGWQKTSSALAKELTELRDALQESETRLREAEKGRDEANHRRNQKEEECRTMYGEIDTLRIALAAETQRREEAEIASRTVHAISSQVLQSLESERDTLRAQLSAAEARNAELMALVGTARGCLEFIRTEQLAAQGLPLAATGVSKARVALDKASAILTK